MVKTIKQLFEETEREIHDQFKLREEDFIDQPMTAAEVEHRNIKINAFWDLFAKKRAKELNEPRITQ